MRDPEESSGPRIGRYRLGDRLGAGGMAEVFVATQAGAAGFERPVCIKRILPHLARDPEFRDLFVREAKLAGRLSHAAIVQVFDCIEDGDTLAIVMELVAGMDLRRLTIALDRRGERLSEGVVAHVAGQLLGALRFAHIQEVIHRDVSPHNVLVSREGEVKLADFGVAKALRSQATRTGQIKGKLAYMSPEQARAEIVDARTDLYSTGLVLFELLEGRRFFNQESPNEILPAVANAAQPRLEGVAPELARLVERLLAPDRDARYASAEDAIRDVPAWELSGPLGAVELGKTLRRIEAEDLSRDTEVARRIPTAALRGGDPDGTDLLRGGTAVVPEGEAALRARPVVVLPPDAQTITGKDEARRHLELARTLEATPTPPGAAPQPSRGPSGTLQAAVAPAFLGPQATAGVAVGSPATAAPAVATGGAPGTISPTYTGPGATPEAVVVEDVGGARRVGGATAAVVVLVVFFVLALAGLGGYWLMAPRVRPGAAPSAPPPAAPSIELPPPPPMPAAVATSRSDAGSPSPSDGGSGGAASTPEAGATAPGEGGRGHGPRGHGGRDPARTVEPPAAPPAPASTPYADAGPPPPPPPPPVRIEALPRPPAPAGPRRPRAGGGCGPDADPFGCVPTSITGGGR